jgi:GNAT superfamily N-acetyltransferase
MKINELYKLSPGDINKGSEVLRDAFKNYPAFTYLFPEINERARKLKYVMEFFIKCGLLNGEVYAPSKNIEGVAIWYKSTQLNLGLPDIFRAGLLNLLFGLNPASFINFKKLGDAKKTNRAKVMKGAYYLLDVIGLDPAYQRKGYGRLLIESKLAQIEEQKMSCFLETSKFENMDYYKKYGFDLLGKSDYKGLRSFYLLKK